MNLYPLFSRCAAVSKRSCMLLTVLCAAGLSSCKTAAPDLHLHHCSIAPQKAKALQKEANLTAYITDGGDVAYLVHGCHICKDAATAAKMLQQEQKPIIVHISYLATMPMVNSAVSPLWKKGVPILYITTVNNRDDIPCVYSPVAADKSHK